MTQDLEYTVILTRQARQLLAEIKDRRERELIVARLNKLKYNPEKQGKALSQELSSYRSIRAVGQRYRIIYRVEAEKVVVLVVGIGRRKEGDRKDVYEVTKQLLTGMLQKSEDEEE